MTETFQFISLNTKLNSLFHFLNHTIELLLVSFRMKQTRATSLNREAVTCYKQALVNCHPEKTIDWFQNHPGQMNN